MASENQSFKDSLGDFASWGNPLVDSLKGRVLEVGNQAIQNEYIKFEGINGTGPADPVLASQAPTSDLEMAFGEKFDNLAEAIRDSQRPTTTDVANDVKIQKQEESGGNKTIIIISGIVIGAAIIIFVLMKRRK